MTLGIGAARYLLILCWALTLVAGAAGPTSGESFADLYLGAAITESTTFIHRFGGLETKSEGIELNRSVSGGLRAGHWFERFPYLGLALDVSHFWPDRSSQTVITTIRPSGAQSTDRFPARHFSITGISIDLLLRWPFLADHEFPNGRLQPYLTLGPTAFIAQTGRAGSNQSADDTALGVTAGGGLAWQFHPKAALFAEYRFTHFHPEFEMRRLGVKVEQDMDINTHHLLLGLSFRF